MLTNGKSILDFLEDEGIPYHSVGDIYRCYCPFHIDKGKPNMFVYPESNSFYCFRCGAGHSAIDFVSNFYEISREDAIQRIYGDNFIKYALEQDKKNQLSDIAMNTLISTSFRGVLRLAKNTKDFYNILQAMKKIDALEKNVNTLPQILREIGEIRYEQ